MKVSVFRKAHFNAAHRLHQPDWSDEQNLSVFGLCNNPNFHGHNYEIELKVTGDVDPITGFVIDTKLLKDILKEEIENRFDHRNLNLDCPEFKDLNPTAENIVIVIYNLVKNRLPAHLEIGVRLYETERNYVEFNGK
jgi:6-pyruvoyltetrahydropterin/6-carboxytetrahydropterin synthase